MNVPLRVVTIGSPVDASTAWFSSVMSAPEPLSYMPVTVETVRTVPATGNGLCSSNDCSACTSSARSKSPRFRLTAAWEISTAKVGSTCCVTPLVFSVVNASSSSGSPSPAPTPTAYSSASFEVQDRSCGSPGSPTKLWSSAMTASWGWL